jgi:hypothetical protein
MVVDGRCCAVSPATHVLAAVLGALKQHVSPLLQHVGLVRAIHRRLSAMSKQRRGLDCLPESALVREVVVVGTVAGLAPTTVQCVHLIGCRLWPA